MLTPRQRLAIVMGKCFTAQTAATRDASRHAVLSQVCQREVRSSADLTDDEIRRLLERWEQFDAPFCPSEKAKKEIAELAAQYQAAHEQDVLL